MSVATSAVSKMAAVVGTAVTKAVVTMAKAAAVTVAPTKSPERTAIVRASVIQTTHRFTYSASNSRKMGQFVRPMSLWMRPPIGRSFRLGLLDPAQSSQCAAHAAPSTASRINRSNFVRTGCGSIFDAHVNAAKNILRLGANPTGRLSGDGP